MSADDPIDHREIVREYVRERVVQLQRERAKLDGLLWRMGLDFPTSNFEFGCSYCGVSGGGSCPSCTRYDDGEACPPGLAEYWPMIDRAHVSGCWVWMGARTASGYARSGKVGSLHRVVYAEMRPDESILTDVLHHKCSVKHCVNPDHLEPMSASDHGTRHYRQANP